MKKDVRKQQTTTTTRQPRIKTKWNSEKLMETKMNTKCLHTCSFVQHCFEEFGLGGPSTSKFWTGGPNTAKYLDPGGLNYFRGGPNTSVLFEVYGLGGPKYLDRVHFFHDRFMTVLSSLEPSPIPYPCILCPSLPFTLCFLVLACLLSLTFSEGIP